MPRTDNPSFDTDGKVSCAHCPHSTDPCCTDDNPDCTVMLNNCPTKDTYTDHRHYAATGSYPDLRYSN